MQFLIHSLTLCCFLPLFQLDAIEASALLADYCVRDVFDEVRPTQRTAARLLDMLGKTEVA